jgi:hypothetical protein
MNEMAQNQPAREDGGRDQSQPREAFPRGKGAPQNGRDERRDGEVEDEIVAPAREQANLLDEHGFVARRTLRARVPHLVLFPLAKKRKRFGV